jgi:hypothetical protein
MIILNTSTTDQTITFVPRKLISYGKMIITKKDERESIVERVEIVLDGDYATITHSFNLTEGSRYSLKIVKHSYACELEDRITEDEGTVEALNCVFDDIDEVTEDDDVIYRDIILCTDQTEYDKYDAQKGEYVEPITDDNKYIVLK